MASRSPAPISVIFQANSEHFAGLVPAPLWPAAAL